MHRTVAAIGPTRVDVFARTTPAASEQSDGCRPYALALGTAWRPVCYVEDFRYAQRIVTALDRTLCRRKSLLTNNLSRGDKI